MQRRVKKVRTGAKKAENVSSSEKKQLSKKTLLQLIRLVSNRSVTRLGTKNILESFSEVQLQKSVQQLQNNVPQCKIPQCIISSVEISGVSQVIIIIMMMIIAF